MQGAAVVLETGMPHQSGMLPSPLGGADGPGGALGTPRRKRPSCSRGPGCAGKSRSLWDKTSPGSFGTCWVPKGDCAPQTGLGRALPPLAARGKMNKMKNFKRRFSLSVPRTETIEESLTEFTEQFNQLNNQRNEGEEPLGPWGGSGPSGVGESLSPAVLGVCGKRLLLVACWSPHSLPVGVDNTSSLKPRRDLSSPEESLMGGKGICPKTGAVVKVEKGNVWDLLLLPQKRG
uniref:CDK18 n=1 Tax=Cyanistes caeruleus TaxID=156563 RepID=A0A8C0V661_CYACU